MNNGTQIRTLLINELELRKRRNSQYSLRAFSRHLGLSPAQLSQILSGKRRLTANVVARIADGLKLSPTERVLAFEALHQLPSPASENHVQVKEDEFKLISDWYHLAILSLSELKSHRSDPRWISRRIGISVQQASDALERLQRLCILEVKDGRMRQVMKPLRVGADVPSAAIRRFHHQQLSVAASRLDFVDLSLREYSAITFAANPKKIPTAKKLITEFKRRLASLLEEGEPQSVYTLAIQLFPLTLEKK